MPARSAGLLCFRPGADGPEVLLVHPGGPYWARRDDGVWSIPKGEVEPGEEPAAVALREFAEELARPRRPVSGWSSVMGSRPVASGSMPGPWPATWT